MSPRRAASSEGGAGRSAIAVVVVAGIALALVFLVRARPSAEPFDPRSGAPTGARGLALLLREYGAEVDVTTTPPRPGTATRVLVLEDRLDADQRVAVLEFVEAGGVAVVADPTSSLHSGPGLDGGSRPLPSAPGGLGPRTDFESNVDIGVCSIDSLTRLRGLLVDGGLSFPTAPDDPACFGDDRHAAVIARPLGEGTMVGLGDNRMWTNRLLDRADNAGLATALLAPARGARVSIVMGGGSRPAGVSEVGSGDRTLGDLVHPSVWMALAQLGLAFIVLAVARGVRPGRVVDESMATAIAGSELVVATGNLMHRAHHAQRAADLLRFEMHRDLSRRLRVPATASLDVLDRVCVERLGTAPGTVSRAFSSSLVVDDRELTTLATTLNEISSLPDRQTAAPAVSDGQQPHTRGT